MLRVKRAAVRTSGDVRVAAVRKTQDISFIEGASTRSHSALGARVWLGRVKTPPPFDSQARRLDVNEEGSESVTLWYEFLDGAGGILQWHGMRTYNRFDL